MRLSLLTAATAVAMVWPVCTCFADEDGPAPQDSAPASHDSASIGEDDDGARQDDQPAQQPQPSPPLARPFAHKLIYAETPDIGGRWRGGLRMTDIIMWEFFFNMSDWFTTDLLIGGFDLQNRQDSTAGHAKDLFWSLTFKSRPILKNLTRDIYAFGVGAKIYRSQLFYKRHAQSADSLDTRDGSLVLFLTQRAKLAQRHHVNLFTSFSFDSYGPSLLRMGPDSVARAANSLYIVPGYQFHIGRSWHIEAEYYMTNSMYLPLQSLQLYGLGNYLENISQQWVSMLLWGVQFRGEHFYIGTHILNHWTFTPPFIPFVSLGYNF